ncbi:MAG TPA: hypothetical protein VJM49_16625, partial [Acidimicrobiales bacterium]|nr:hypothetical protein [Acidimicrobiales bacterium]
TPHPVPDVQRLGAIASIAAGAIHATAAGAHAEHRAAVIAFVLTAVAQIGWGVLALGRAGRWVSLGGVAVNLAAVVGWMVAKTSGIGFVQGLDAAESPRFADTLAAVLALVAVAGAVFALAAVSPVRGRPLVVGAGALAALALVVPAMVSTGGHEHGGGRGAAGHEHASAPTPPRPYDGTLPVDLGGVPGVTAEQQADAEALVTETIEKLPRFAEVGDAEAAGYHTIGDALSGWEHYINWDLMDDDAVLDPDLPESLVYEVDPVTDERTLVAAMFMAASDTTLDDVPGLGGDLVQWHIHNDLCYGGEPGEWTLFAYASPPAPCPPGTSRRTMNPMMHVWITPHECGPFASLEGLGAGQIAPGEQRACDLAHGSH